MRPVKKLVAKVPVAWKRPLYRLRREIGYLKRMATARARGEELLLPPVALQELVGGEHFEGIGQAFCAHLVDPGGLRPGDRVLDGGCGAGRIAIPLTRYLGAHGSYDGLDIVPGAIQWCQRHITARDPRFRFHLADIRSQTYNPRGGSDAAVYRFPFPDDAFDFVLLTSVFSHLLPAALANYASQIARVLRPGGGVFATFFLITEAALANIERSLSKLAFVPHAEGFFSRKDEAPEDAIAYREEHIREVFARNGLRIREPIHYGGWSGREDGFEFQDVVLGEKG